MYYHIFILSISFFSLLSSTGYSLVEDSSFHLKELNNIALEGKSLSVTTKTQRSSPEREFLSAKAAAFLQKNNIPKEIMPFLVKYTLNKHTQTATALYHFTYQLKPIWGFYLKIHHLKEGLTHIDSFLPPSLHFFQDIDDKESALGEAQSQAAHFLEGENFIYPAAEQCFFYKENTLYPAWCLEVQDIKENKNFFIITNAEQVFYSEEKSFHIEGQTRAYISNMLDDKLVDETWNLKNTGYLENDFLTTDTGNTQKAFFPNYKFFTDATDTLFPEINAFAHTHRMLDWYKSIGFVWSDLAPITIKIHDQNKVNNAAFLPKTSSSPAKIVIGDGDGKLLDHLTTDFDVVAHELGHYIIYSYLTSTNQIENSSTPIENWDQSLALHEGLADSFTFLKTDNACLGESICPNESTICFVERKCLRTAENSLTYGSSEYWSYSSAHIKGQVISGLVWDIRQHENFSLEKTIAILFRSLSYLAERSRYYHLLNGIILANRELYKGENECALIDLMNDRGFTQETSEISTSCSENVSQTAKEENKNKDDKSTPMCGFTIKTPPSHLFWFIILLLFPIINPSIYRKKTNR